VYDRYKVINLNHPKPFQDANGKLEMDDLIFLEMLGIGWNCVLQSALRISIVLSMFFEHLGAKSDNIRWFWSWLILVQPAQGNGNP